MIRQGSIAVAAFVLFSAGVAQAQGTRASIGGLVLDATGAAVPGAELTLRSLNTTAVVKATSGIDGLYEFPNLVAGVYELSVTAKGFREYLQKGISVNLDQRVRADVPLEVGTTT